MTGLNVQAALIEALAWYAVYGTGFVVLVAMLWRPL